MSKHKIIALNEAWWVWLGEESAIRFETEKEAIELLLAKGKEYGIANSFGRSDSASAIAELIWDVPLSEGKKYHKVVLSPVITVLHRGIPRKMVPWIPAKEVKSVSKSWSNLPEGISAWWPDQYQSALTGGMGEIMVARGNRALEVQLDEKWPLLDP